MKFTYLLVIFTLLSSCSSEKNEVQTVENKNPLDGLVEGELSDLGSDEIVSINDTSIIYAPDGSIVPKHIVLERLISGNYIAVPYVDQNDEYTAIVIRKATKTEKNKFEKNKNNGTSSHWVSKEFPLVSVEDIHGKKWTVDELKGKVTVLNFWFIKCKPCLMEIPELNKIVADFQSNEDIIFLAFAEDQKNDLKQFLNFKNFDYNIIPGSESFTKQLGVDAFPTHMVLDKKGVVSYAFTGYSAKTADAIRNEINSLLKA